MDDQSGFDPVLAGSLAKDIRSIIGRLKRRLREHSDHSDLTASQTSVLLRLEIGGPATIADLARAEGMRHQSMSAVVGPLQQTGLIQGAPNPSDGRQTLLSLTPKCLKVLAKGRAARQDWLAKKIGAALSSHEQERLRSALELLGRLVQD